MQQDCWKNHSRRLAFEMLHLFPIHLLFDVHDCWLLLLTEYFHVGQQYDIRTFLTSDLGGFLERTTKQSSPQNRQCSMKLKLCWLEWLLKRLLVWELSQCVCCLSANNRSMWCFEQYVLKQFEWHVICTVPSSILWKRLSSRWLVALMILLMRVDWMNLPSTPLKNRTYPVLQVRADEINITNNVFDFLLVEIVLISHTTYFVDSECQYLTILF